MKPISFLLLLLAPAFAHAQGVITDSFSDVTRIDLSTGSGDAIFVKGGGSTVQLHLEYTYSDDVFKPKIRQSGSNLFLEEDFTGRNYRGRATWTLTVPDGLDVRFSTGSGDFRAEDLQMNLKTSLGSGDVDLKRFTGDVTFSSGSGDLSVDRFNGSIRASTGSGDIEAKSVIGDVSASTGSGDVEITMITGSLKASTGSGDISAERFTPTGDVKLATGSGDILVSLSGSAPNDISLASGSGSSQLDLNGTKLTGELVMRTGLNRGRIEAPFAFDSTTDVRTGGNRHRESVKVFGNSDQRVNISTGSGAAIIRE